VTLRIQSNGWIPFTDVAAYLPHLEVLRVNRPRSGYDLSTIDTQGALLLQLHTIKLVEFTTRDVEAGIGTILSLPSVRRILFDLFYFVIEMSTPFVNVDQVREWLYGYGIIANVRKAPELKFDSTPSPFL
jgi:hypothetical protein